MSNDISKWFGWFFQSVSGLFNILSTVGLTFGGIHISIIDFWFVFAFISVICAVFVKSGGVQSK